MNRLKIEKKKSLVSIILSLVGLIAVSVFIGFILRQNTYLLPFDKFFYELIDKIPHTGFLDGLFFFFDYNPIPINTHPQFFLIMVLVPAIYIRIKKRTEFWFIILAFIIGAIISRILVFTDTTLVFRERPWEVLPNHVAEELKTALKSWTSYPSGHTRDTLMLGLIASYFLPKIKYFAIFLALLVGFSRLYFGVHFPTDVLSGLILGFWSYILTIKIIEYIRNRKFQTQGSK